MTVNFKGQDYVAQPGTEGLAMLVFDVPGGARGVRGGVRVRGGGAGKDDERRRVGEEEDSVQEEEEEDFVVVKAGKTGGGNGKGKGMAKGMGREKGRKEALFEVRCTLVVRLGMPLGS